MLGTWDESIAICEVSAGRGQDGSKRHGAAFNVTQSYI
jgi:hypothetical protein